MFLLPAEAWSRFYSILLSRLLNDLGYHKSIVRKRQQCVSEAFKILENEVGRYNIYGSTREGINTAFESDFDEMTVSKLIVCHSGCCDDYSCCEGLMHLKMERNDTAHGYCLLKWNSLDHPELPETDSFFYKRGDQYYLSNKKMNEIHRVLLEWRTRHLDSNFVSLSNFTKGPSCPSKVFIFDIDNVLAFRCNCPLLIKQWTDRPRSNDWPSQEIINEVSSLEAHVVPVGYKESPSRDIEWRICFTLGEIRLIESLNDVQLKLLVLLKLIAKDVMKPICEEMTSYVMKNLVFWMAEKQPSEEFAENKLLLQLQNALIKLRRCIIRRDLRSYMIEERNLLADRISDDQVSELSQTIDTLLDKGPKMLFRCQKIRNAYEKIRTCPNQYVDLDFKVKLFDTLSIKYMRPVCEYMKQNPHILAHLNNENIIKMCCSVTGMKPNKVLMFLQLYNKWQKNNVV